MQDQGLSLALRVDRLRSRLGERKEPRIQEQGVRDGQGGETFIWRCGEDVEESGTAEGMSNKLDRREVNLVVESSPVNGNVVHACKLSTITIDHELFEGIPSRVYLKPSDIQLLHTESETILNSVPNRESIIREGARNVERALTYEEAASGI